VHRGLEVQKLGREPKVSVPDTHKGTVGLPAAQAGEDLGEVVRRPDLQHLEAQGEARAAASRPLVPPAHLLGKGVVALLPVRLVDGQVGLDHLPEEDHGVLHGRPALAHRVIADREAVDQRTQGLGEGVAGGVLDVAVRRGNRAAGADLEAERRGEALGDIDLELARLLEDGRHVLGQSGLPHRVLERLGLVGRDELLLHGVCEQLLTLVERENLVRLAALHEEPAVLHAERLQELGLASHEKHSSHALPPSANTRASRRAPPQRCRMN